MSLSGSIRGGAAGGFVCPDWPGLVAERERRGDDPPAWSSALDHRSECDSCREASLRAAPELVFRGALDLAIEDDSEDSTDDSLVEEMRLRVMGARRQVEAGHTPSESAPSRRAAAGWLAAAALLVASLAVVSLDLGEASDTPASRGERVAAAGDRPAADSAVDRALRDHLTLMPVVESSNPIRAQFAAEDFDLVWVVADGGGAEGLAADL